jgi:hypothetical protein
MLHEMIVILLLTGVVEIMFVKNDEIISGGELNIV